MREGKVRVSQDDLGPVRRRTAALPRTRTRGNGGVLLVVVVLLIAALVGGLVVGLLHRGTPPGVSDGSAPASRVVVFVIDGLDPSAIPARGLPNIDALIHAGTLYDNAFIGQMESDPVASSATIGTGVLPRADGVIGSEWRDPSSGRLATPATPAQVRLGSLDQIMQSRNPNSLPSTLKDAKPGARVLAVGGSACGPPDAAGTWLADYVVCIARRGKQWTPVTVVGHDLPPGRDASIAWTSPVRHGRGPGPKLEGWYLGAQDDYIARTAVAAMRVTGPALTFIDFPELDLLAPHLPPARERPVTSVVLRGIDRDIGMIERSLAHRKLLAGTAFLLTSGDTYTTIRRTISRTGLENAIIAAGGQEVYIDGGTAAYIGLRDPLQAQPVAQVIESEHLSGVEAIYYLSHSGGSPTYQAQFLDPLLSSNYTDAAGRLLGTMASNTAPDVVLMLAPGTALRSTSGHGSRQTMAANGLGWDSQRIPLLLSGHGVAAGLIAHHPATLVDLAPTVEALLGIRPQRASGNVLADSLLVPPQGAMAQQRLASRRLSPIVRALRQQLSQSTGS